MTSFLHRHTIVVSRLTSSASSQRELYSDLNRLVKIAYYILQECLFASVCLPVWPSIRLSVCLSVCMTAWQQLRLRFGPPVPVDTLGSSLTPEKTIRRSAFTVQPLPMWCWLSSGLPGMFCVVTFLDVLFFAFRHLESMTLQPSNVDGLVDAVCDPPCGIYALLQYLPVFTCA